MKKVVITVLAGLLLSFIVVSCTNDSADDNLYEKQGIDNKEVKDGDI